MRRILAIAMLVVVTVGVVWYIVNRRPMPNFDVVGGTIVVYKMPADVDSGIMIESLQNRMNAGGLEYVKVAKLPDAEIEFRVPNTEHHPQDLEALKTLVSRRGVLEMRILANGADDSAAIADAKRLINEETDPEALKKLAEEGKLPPAPEKEAGTPKFYSLVLPRGSKSRVAYSWVEIGPQERRSLGFSEDARTDPERKKIWNQLAGDNRGKAVQVQESGGRKLMQGALFYSRECVDKTLSQAVRDVKKFDYFVLARTPETINPDDVAEEKLTPILDGRYFSDAYMEKVPYGVDNYAATFRVNREGDELLATLTRKNVPSDGGEDGGVKRHLAMILDGMVVTAPTINSEVRGGGQIAGQFIRREVDEIVALLRGGALPAALSAEPVRETKVAAKK